MGISSKDILSSIEKATEHQLSLQADEGYWWYTLEANESICAEAIFLMHFMGEVDEATQAGLARRILSCQRNDGTWALYYGGPPDLSTTIECYWALKVVNWSSRLQPAPDDVAQDFSPAKTGRSKDLRYKSGIANSLARARDFILTSGGITRARVFTKIHLAQFGLIPWSACPAMPVELMLMPTWAPVNIYEFSSWARACIIPLLVVMNKKPVRPFNIIPPSPPLEKGGNSTVPPFAKGGKGGFDLNELFAEPVNERSWHYKTDKAFLSWDSFFINLNKFLKLKEYIPNPLGGVALKKCEEWICEHIAKTEDIYPALAYGAMALSVLGHPNSHPMIRKALNALKSFRQVYEGDDLPASVIARSPAHPELIVSLSNDEGWRDDEAISRTQVNNSTVPPLAKGGEGGFMIHQQCCISPVWDTPWQLTALLEAGVPADHPALLKSGRWLISKQITKTYGDWKFKNPDAKPGGWSFEFENEFYPDVDDTIQVLHVLNHLALPEAEKREPLDRGLKWLLSMQNDDGGWGAFDKNQTLEIVNKIPFSDHGACLDPSSPDITARMLGLLAGVIARSPLEADDEAISCNKLSPGDRHASLPPKGRRTGTMTKALDYLKRTQEPFGAWSGRWGVNYIYGTWCVLTGLASIIIPPSPPLPATTTPAGREKGGNRIVPPFAKGGEGGFDDLISRIETAANWLISIQHEDGGWSEEPFSYKMQKYAPYPRCHCACPPAFWRKRSEAIPRTQLNTEDAPPFAKGGEGGFGVPSQTAWALMGLIAARSVIARSPDKCRDDEAIPRGQLSSGDCHAASRLPPKDRRTDAMTRLNTSISCGVEFLIDRLKDDGTWDEKEFTGTGFPNHFYIRYHGYRHFFPLLALGKYYRSNL